MGTPWDISGGVYDSKFLAVGTQDSNPQSVAFSADGTKAYINGVTNDKIFQYTLSTAWDISTGSYASKSMDYGAEMTTGNGFTLADSGTKCYVISSAGIIYRYTLTTAWDISTGVYASDSLDISTQADAPFDIDLSTDGTKVYAIDKTDETIYQYTLSTPWSVNSGSYANKSMSFATQATAMRGGVIGDSGTKYYVADPGSNTIYQYNLTTAWDISTGSYASKSMAVGSEDTNQFDIALSTDGTKAYTVGLDNTKIYQYKLVDVAAVAAGWGRIPIGG